MTQNPEVLKRLRRIHAENNANMTIQLGLQARIREMKELVDKDNIEDQSFWEHELMMAESVLEAVKKGRIKIVSVDHAGDDV